jgi:hypothetical protein
MVTCPELSQPEPTSGGDILRVLSLHDENGSGKHGIYHNPLGMVNQHHSLAGYGNLPSPPNRHR